MLTFSWTDLSTWTTDDFRNLAFAVAAVCAVAMVPFAIMWAVATTRYARAGEQRMEVDRLRVEAMAEMTRAASIAETYARAASCLTGDSVTMRLSGIYTLERIAQASADDHWSVMEVLSAFIREAAPWIPESAEMFAGAESQVPLSPSPDIQAALTVLSRRDVTYETEAQVLDLRGTDLRYCSIKGANLERVNLSGANLQGAMLLGVNLRGAFLWGSRFEHARLSQVNLQDAKLFKADFRNAAFVNVNLSGAEMVGAVFGHAKLTGARGLTSPQVASAEIDNTTELPDYLRDAA